MNFRYAYMICAGWLAIAASVPADIVWSGEQNLSGDEQYIDLNFDSLVDVLLSYSSTGDPSVESGSIDAYLDGLGGIDSSNRILVDSSDGYDAALPFGTLISAPSDPSMEWTGGTYAAGRVSYWVVYNPEFPGPPLESDEEWRGLLGEDGNTYIGIAFEVEGSTHYGWANIALGPEGYLGFEEPITTSWAYESTPDTAIIAGAIPEPSTGVLTMVGSISLLLLARGRRRGKQGSGPLPRARASKAPATPEEWR